MNLKGKSPDCVQISSGKCTQEQRRYQRFETLGKDIRCTLLFPGATNILNISMDGVKLTMDKGLHIGKACLLNFQYRNKIVSVQGKVIWSCLSASRKDKRGNVIPVYSVGMQFLKVIEEEKTNLRQIVEGISSQEDTSLSGIENIVRSWTTI